MSTRGRGQSAASGLLHVSRLKGGVPSTHPSAVLSLRTLRRLRRRYSGSAAYVVTTERGGLKRTMASAVAARRDHRESRSRTIDRM